jgi:large subunit ribosomal protein L9
MAHSEVLLLKPVDGLGGEGDQVKVRAGYARNFLLPRKIAVPVTKSNRKQVEALKKRRGEREAQELNGAQALGAEAREDEPRLRGQDRRGRQDVRRGHRGRSSTTSWWPRGLRSTASKIHLFTPVKTLGKHTVKVKLHAMWLGRAARSTSSRRTRSSPRPTRRPPTTRSDRKVRGTQVSLFSTTIAPGLPITRGRPVDPTEWPKTRVSPPAQSGRAGRKRGLPHSVEAEEYLLSCCLIDGADVVDRPLPRGEGSRPESFYVPAHGIDLFEKLMRPLPTGSPVDVAVLAEELKTSRQLDAVGGYAFLARQRGIPTTAQAGYFIEQGPRAAPAARDHPVGHRRRRGLLQFHRGASTNSSTRSSRGSSRSPRTGSATRARSR